ncbi:MAG: UPF0280 family protein [Syntrophobacteraceae bacterium]
MGVARYNETDRFYRLKHKSPKGWRSFRVLYRETDLWVRAKADLEREAMEAVLSCRLQLERYIGLNDLFLRTLTPLPDDPMAPPIVRRMLEAALSAGVGPMAAVAGAVAEAVGVFLEKFSDSLIVENGGDCYINMDEETTVDIFAGPRSPFQGKIAIKLGPERFPLGVCTSSATVGPSLSLGNADAVTVISPNAALADAAATRLGNMVKTSSDIDRALALAPSIAGVEGVLIMIRDKIGIWGNVELAPV